jgi:hypothetical protein
MQNRLAAWNFANEQGNHTIPQPVLSILATEVRLQSTPTDLFSFADAFVGPRRGYGTRCQVAPLIRLFT